MWGPSGMQTSHMIMTLRPVKNMPKSQLDSARVMLALLLTEGDYVKDESWSDLFWTGIHTVQNASGCDSLGWIMLDLLWSLNHIKGV